MLFGIVEKCMGLILSKGWVMNMFQVFCYNMLCRDRLLCILDMRVMLILSQVGKVIISRKQSVSLMNVVDNWMIKKWCFMGLIQ